MDFVRAIKKQIIETGAWIVAKQLTWGTSGNISVRHGEEIYITAGGSNLGRLTEDDIIRCSWIGEYSGDKKPSKELEMHAAVYQSRSDINAIVHASPFYSTFCACSEIQLRTNLFIEAMYYDENIMRIPYYHAGSSALASAVKGSCLQTNVILMENHGVLVYDLSLEECRNALEITENMCKMNILAVQRDILLKEVPPETVMEFLEGNYKKRRNRI